MHIITASVSLRVQKDVHVHVYLHPDLEFWTQLVAIGDRTENLDVFDILTDAKAGHFNLKEDPDVICGYCSN